MNPEQAQWLLLLLRSLVRWVKVSALAMALIAGMNFISFLCNWWQVLSRWLAEE
jgi:hypothetical protein